MNKKEQDRKLYFFLPIVLVPFLAIMFLLLGGGGGGGSASASVGGGERKSMLNTEVPQEKGVLENVVDKLSVYKDTFESQKARERAEKKDPYNKLLDSESDEDAGDENLIVTLRKKYLKNPDEISFATKEDSLIKKLEQEENALQEKLNLLNTRFGDKTNGSSGAVAATTSIRSGRVAPQATAERELSYPSTLSAKHSPPAVADDDLQAQLVAFKQQTDQMVSQEDGEFSDMKEMLDKILDIQHPERVKERLKEQSRQEKGDFYAVQNSKNYVPVDYLGENKNDMYRQRYKQYLEIHQDTVYKVVPKAMVSGFISLSDHNNKGLSNGVKAMIHESTVVTDGSQIKIRLLNDIVVRGIEIRANNFIYGECRIHKGRVTIAIASLQTGAHVIPVDMNIYDKDGMQGIHVNGLAEASAARDIASQTGSNLNLRMADPSLQGQIINEGVRGIKNVFRNKTRIQKATLKAGHEILLINTEM